MKSNKGKLLGMMAATILTLGLGVSAVSAQIVAVQADPNGAVLSTGDDTFDARNQTPATEALIEAAWNCDKDGVTRALEAGADPNAYYISGIMAPNANTPLMLSMHCEGSEIPETLIEHGADPMAKSSSGFTALRYALNNPASATVLAQAKGFDINASENVMSIGDVVLRGLAREEKDPELNAKWRNEIEEKIDFLVNTLGFDINAKGKNGETLLMMATHNVPLEVLIKYGADVNATSDALFTALMYNARDGYVDLVQTLIKNGANVNMKNAKGHTAKDLAQINGHQDIVNLL